MNKEEHTILKRKVLFEKRMYFYGIVRNMSNNKIHIIKKCEIEDIKLSRHREKIKKYIKENIEEFFVCIKNDGIGIIILKEYINFVENDEII